MTIATTAEYFIEHVALGPGTSGRRLPDGFRTVLEANAPTYLDELADPTALSIDTSALATTMVPMLLTHGTESPEVFPAAISELARLVPAAQVEVLEGAGHIPHPPHRGGLERSARRVPRRQCPRRVAASAMWSAMTLSSSISLARSIVVSNVQAYWASLELSRNLSKAMES